MRRKRACQGERQKSRQTQTKMVRTKANNAAVRKAVAAKAPRKNLGGARTVPSITSPSTRRSRKSKPGSSSNPVRSWPKPEWQKGIDIFLSPNAQRSSSSSDGACSSRSTVTDPDQNTRSKEPAPTSDGEEPEEELTEGDVEEAGSTDEEEDDDLVPESEEESEMDEEDTATSKIAMLGKDLVCGSDDDDDD